MLAVLEEQPNEYVTVYLLCQKMGTLPYGGGLLDQPSKMIDMFILIENARMARQKLDEGLKNG